MLPSLLFTAWALAASHVMAEATTSPEAADIRVTWEDLMVATSKYPRFFGSPATISRNDTPKVIGLSTVKDQDRPPYGKIRPVECSSDGGNFTCPVFTNCKDCFEDLKQDLIPAYAALQERNSTLGHHLNGLNFISDFVKYVRFRTEGRTLQKFFFTQTLDKDGAMPIDNSQVVLGLNKRNATGETWPAPSVNQHMVYTGNFSKASTRPECEKHRARDTAAQAALNQPFWQALNPEHVNATVIHTVQDGRLYLTWRLKFDLVKEVGDDFYVWVNARNCSEVVAAAPAKMENYLSDLEAFQKEQKRLFKEEKGIEFAPPPLD